MANSETMYAVCEIMQLCAVGNFVSADRVQVDQIGLRWNWIESRLNLAPSANAPIASIQYASDYIGSLNLHLQQNESTEVQTLDVIRIQL